MADILTWLNYHHLRCFVAVVQEGGLVAAARRLNVSHPTVSEQLRKLEDHLELRLFERRGRRLRLTEDGKLVYRYAEQVFGTGSALLSAVEARRVGKAVVARVGVDSVLAKLVVRAALSPMLDAFGDRLRLRCTEDEREHLIEGLNAHRLDLVLTDAPARLFDDAERTQAHLLSTSGVGFFAAPALADRLQGPFPACLDNAPFLLPMPSTRLRRELERWLGAARLNPRVFAEIEDSGLLKALGQDGRGVFAMPSDIQAQVCAQYDVRLLGSTDDILLRLYAITHASPHTNPAIQALLDGSNP